jgi:hypothetical protein
VRKCLQALKMYPEFKSQQILRDQLLTRRVELAKMRRILKPWQRAANTITGLRHMNKFLPRLECLLAFKKIVSLTQNNENCLNTMVAQRREHLKFQCFRQLYCYSRRKEVRQANVANIQNRNRFHRLNQVVAEWKRVHDFQMLLTDQTEKLIMAYSLWLKARAFKILER